MSSEERDAAVIVDCALRFMSMLEMRTSKVVKLTKELIINSMRNAEPYEVDFLDSCLNFIEDIEKEDL